MSRTSQFALIFLMLQWQEALGFIDRAIYGDWFGKGGDKFTLSLGLLSIAASVFLFVRGRCYVRPIRTGSLLSIAVACLLLFSATWSIDPSTTIRRGVQYFFVVLGAIGIATNFEP